MAAGAVSELTGLLTEMSCKTQMHQPRCVSPPETSAGGEYLTGGHHVQHTPCPVFTDLCLHALDKAVCLTRQNDLQA